MVGTRVITTAGDNTYCFFIIDQDKILLASVLNIITGTKWFIFYEYLKFSSDFPESLSNALSVDGLSTV